jgi:hypothetical protein
MPRQRTLDDASVEAVLRGGTVAPDLVPLVDIVSAIRAAATQPVRPSGELAERMASGVFGTDQPRSRSKAGTMSSKLAAMSLRAKVAAGCAVALTGLTGVTAAGALPDAAQERVETMIESVTPIDFVDRAEFGQEVADDAQDGGVDGQEISERAKEQGLGQLPVAPEVQGQADERRPDLPESGLSATDQTPPQPSEDRPVPDDHPGAGSGGPPDDLPTNAEGGSPAP